jgi:hypothetical protein
MGLFAAVETRSLVAIGLSSSVIPWPAATSACFLALSVAETLEKRGLIKESYLVRTSLPEMLRFKLADSGDTDHLIGGSKNHDYLAPCKTSIYPPISPSLYRSSSSSHARRPHCHSASPNR